jgi:hypothetical protein
VLLENPFRRLRPGMAVVGTVPLPSIRGIMIPETAFTDDNHDTILTVTQADVVKTVHVTEVGSDDKDSIVTGIESGTRVVNDGQMSIGDGEKVVVDNR